MLQIGVNSYNLGQESIRNGPLEQNFTPEKTTLPLLHEAMIYDTMISNPVRLEKQRIS